MAQKKGKSLFKTTFELQLATSTILAEIFIRALIARFKKHRDTANIRFDKIVGLH